MSASATRKSASLPTNPLMLSVANSTAPVRPSPLPFRKRPDCRMNSDSSRLRQQQQQQEEQSTQLGAQQQSKSAQQFDSPEEMIRFDAIQNPAPPSIAE